MRKLSTTIVSLIGLLVPFVVFAASFCLDTGGTLSNGLQAYYKLEDVTDSFGTSTLSNAGSVGFVSGKLANAADFGATNTTKYLSVSSSLNIDGVSTSLAAWVNVTTDISDGGEYAIVSQGNGAGTKVTNQFRYTRSGSTRTLNATRGKDNVANQDAAFNTDLGTGVWHHMVYSYNADSQTLNLFLDGVSVATTTSVTGSGAVDHGTYFEISGFRPAEGANGKFSGIVDEVGVWKKALTLQEVVDLYNSGTGQTFNTSTCAVSTSIGRQSSGRFRRR